MTKAVIFDMNGIIIDDEGVHERVFAQALKKYGIAFSHQDYVKYCAGKTDRDGLEDIQKKHSIKINIDQALQEKRKNYFKLFAKYKKSYPGVIDLIKKLSPLVAIALVSGATQKEVNLILKTFKVARFFKVTVSGDEVTHGKPNPEPYLKASQKLKTKPSECLAIEDSPAGVKSAKAAGMHCIAITTTHTQDKLKQADLVVKCFKQITLEKIFTTVPESPAILWRG